MDLRPLLIPDPQPPVLVRSVPGARADAFAADPRVAQHGSATVTVARVDRPRRRRVMRAMAAACRYPRHLMFGDPEYALATLAAREGRRLSTFFGSLDGQGASA